MEINKKNTNKALFKNTGIIAIGQLSTKLINFFLLPLYTALLTTEEYGTVDLLSTYSGLIVIVVGLQMTNALFRFLVTNRDDEDKIKHIVSTVLIMTVVILMGYTVVFLCLQPFVHIVGKWYLLAHVIATLYLQLMSNTARGLGKNADYASANFLSAAVSLVLNVITIAVLHWGIQAMLVSYVIGPIVGGTFLLFKNKIYRYISPLFFSKNETKIILKYSCPLIPNELSWSVIHASDRIVISNIISVAANGIVAAASRFSAIYTTCFSIFNTSWTEQVFLHYKEEGGKKYICEMFDKMVTFFASVAIGIIACIPFIFSVLVNEKFDEAYGLIPLYLIAVFFNAVIGMISAVYLVENETKKVAVSTVVAAIINLSVDLILVNFIGIYAAPVSSICGYATISIWRLIDINRRHCRVTMTIKKVILLIFLFFVSCIAYYSSYTLIKIFALIIVIVGAILINRSFLHDIMAMLKRKA